ncbi:MAG: SHOCT domain-containing protein [Methanosphaera stadtmanae]|nr:SHOCT domain-containing protein [Methanosphaera stadtmanae]
MIVDKQLFKELRKEGGGLFNEFQSTAKIESNHEEIKDGDPCNVYIVPKGVLIDITFGKKICIYFNDIQDISVNDSKIVIASADETTKLNIASQKNINLIYNKIRENCGLEPENIKIPTKKEIKNVLKAEKNKEKEYIKEHICEFNSMNGLPVSQGSTVKIEKLEDKILITAGTYIQEIKYSEIVNIENRTFIEEKIKNKSTVGRAVTGGLLFGGVGAIVGGMTGGQKKEVNKKFGFEITYLKNGIQTKIVLEEKLFKFNSDKFMKSILETANQIPIASTNNTDISVVDIADQIKKLSDLKDAGIITEEEFQQGKDKILQQ